MSNKEQLDDIIRELEVQGISMENYNSVEGLGDKVEAIIGKLGLSEDLVQSFFGIGGCGCQKRKKWLNSVLSFLKK